MKRQLAEQRGRKAEDEAARWLEGQGWDIVARRRKTKVGEIDLVARREGLIAFIEVKWRQRAADLDLAIDEYRLSRVAAAAESVAHEYAGQGEDLRIDVILLAPGSQPRHIENAWMP
ncbi:YraN family protein [Aurantiacibacter hainanensis]|uniref:YraN family protein n=1 Tax=Aurantiacibacter hainanensis TaxID=3076114 RepID=UPI0030C7235D